MTTLRHSPDLHCCTSRAPGVGAALCLILIALGATSGTAEEHAGESAAKAGDVLVFRAVSEGHQLNVTLRPLANRLSINRFEKWEVQLMDPEGAPVFPARIMIGGGMLGHGHGLPTQPAITRYLGEGRYLVEGLKLNMIGDWSLFVTIETPNLLDRAVVELTVSY